MGFCLVGIQRLTTFRGAPSRRPNRRFRQAPAPGCSARRRSSVEAPPPPANGRSPRPAAPFREAPLPGCTEPWRSLVGAPRHARSARAPRPTGLARRESRRDCCARPTTPGPQRARRARTFRSRDRARSAATSTRPSQSATRPAVAASAWRTNDPPRWTPVAIAAVQSATGPTSAKYCQWSATSESFMNADVHEAQHRSEHHDEVEERNQRSGTPRPPAPPARHDRARRQQRRHVDPPRARIDLPARVDRAQVQRQQRLPEVEPDRPPRAGQPGREAVGADDLGPDCPVGLKPPGDEADPDGENEEGQHGQRVCPREPAALPPHEAKQNERASARRRSCSATRTGTSAARGRTSPTRRRRTGATGRSRRGWPGRRTSPGRSSLRRSRRRIRR